MSTTMAKKETLERGWYIIDAAGKPVGKVAALAASILNGKNKPTYTPHVDCGDHVVIINASKAVFTGKKMTDKMYYHHSGYIGGLKFISAGALMKSKPEAVLELAVKGMLPKNSIGAASFNRLKVYADAEHKQQAQKPVCIEA
ncbi:MAG: 50S ribosomal protein L13 [Clostridia bacterium]|nr:50S ribosomal protein L13 [Clostridia bacterium]